MTCSSVPDPATEDYRPVLDLAAAQAVPITEIHIEGHVLAVALVEGAAVAFQALCPHDKAGLAAGRIEGCTLSCPRHLASFDLRSGAVSKGWKVDALRLYPARIEAGKIAVDMAAVRRNPPGGARKVWDMS
jgi:3-phenylpropionate/trans-cinnamate dioxygenase ferredoxin subunit